MSDRLPQFLRHRSRRSYLHVLLSLNSLSNEEALHGSSTKWPDHAWGIGQNGSIAGIVYHLAAWKELTLGLLLPGGRFIARDEFDPGLYPLVGEWPALVEWYRDSGERWLNALNSLEEREFDADREWEGVVLSVSKLCAEMMEHDVYHLAQIEYLKQLHLHETT